MISIKNLSFAYRDQSIFSDLSLDIEENQWVGILGLNGAGKSTLLKIILGLLHPQSGTVQINGLPPGRYSLKSIVGSSLQDIDFPHNIRVGEILDFVGAHYSNPVAKEQLAQDFFLKDFINKKCGDLSGGMRRRLSLACAFIGRPKLLLLDEPTTGLDAQSRQQLMTNISRYQKESESLVLMISHHPQDIVGMANQFLLLKQGHPHSWITPEKINHLTSLKRIRFHSNDQGLRFTQTVSCRQLDDQFEIASQDSDQVVRELNKQTQDYKDLAIENLSLDEVLQEFL